MVLLTRGPRDTRAGIAKSVIYDYRLGYRAFLKSGGNCPVIPPRKNAREPETYDKELYGKRKQIEMTFGNLKENKRIDTRFDKLDTTFLSFIALGFLKKFLGLFIC